jgi:cobalt-zinc-cadmium efflux system outer membrane protein
MLIRKLHLLTFLIALPLSAIAAENGGGSITLADALARTLRGNPELAAYNYELRAAEARILQAGLRPNPELSLDIENPTGSGPYKSGDQMENTLTLSQLIELGGKRPARISEAEAGRGVIEREYQVKRVEVLKATTLAFIDALAAQRRMELSEEVMKVSGDAVALTEQRVGIGKANAVEAIRAKVAVSSARIEVEQARRDLGIARGHLAAQWGARKADFGTVRGDLDRHQPGPSLQTLRQRLLGNPDLARWTAEREKREARLAKEQTLARPDLTVRAGPRMEGKGDDATFVLGFSLPLPLSNRNQGNIAEARANLAKLDEEKRAAEARAFAALNEAYQKLTGASREIEILEESVIPGAQDAEKQLNDGYAAGRFTQFEVLDARRTLNAARVQQVRALADFLKARAELDALTARAAELPRPLSVTKPIPAKPARAKRK